LTPRREKFPDHQLVIDTIRKHFPSEN